MTATVARNGPKALKCHSCRHWEYTDLYTEEWEERPETHLFAWGACALLNDEGRVLREVQCAHCEVHRRGRDVRVALERRGEHTYPTIDTHWRFGCIRWEAATAKESFSHAGENTRHADLRGRSGDGPVAQ